MQIGNITLKNRLILAPMAGITDLPFRLLAKEQGCGLVVSEMVSAKGLIMGGDRTHNLLMTTPEEKPIAIQLFGAEAASMAEAAVILEEKGAQIVDVNMGCPVKKVVSSGAGSALLKDLNKAGEILSSIRKRINIPLTIKIRTGWDHNSIVALEMLKVAEASGIDAMAVHGRTRSQGYGGKADWALIAQVKEQATIPIIGNGDIECPEDVSKIMVATGCDGVMIGRGALGNPWIFSQALDYMKMGAYVLPSSEEKATLVLRHLHDVVDMYGENKGVKLFRKHLSWYAKGMTGSSRFRSGINSANTLSEVEKLIRDFSFSASPHQDMTRRDYTSVDEGASLSTGMV